MEQPEALEESVTAVEVDCFVWLRACACCGLELWLAVAGWGAQPQSARAASVWHEG